MNASKGITYKICFEQHLNPGWYDWFPGLMIHPDFNQEGKPITIISGIIKNKDRLDAILDKIRELGVKVLYVEEDKL